MIYELDPDFRRKYMPPAGVKMCCRCQKDIKDVSRARPVTVAWEEWAVIDGHDKEDNFPAIFNRKVIGNELMGSDCWKKVSKMPKQGYGVINGVDDE